MTSIKSEQIPEFITNDSCPGVIPQAHEVTLFLGKFDVFHETPVSDEERLRAESMTSTATRHGFLAGRRLVRKVLSKWLSSDSATLPILLSPEGRPYLAGDSSPCFSISHSGDLVVAAFSGVDLGVDLELERPLDRIALSARFFSEKEARLVREQENDKTFFKLWTSREAAIKADGRGMGRLLPLTKVRVETLEKEFLNVEIGSDSWTVAHSVIDSGYHVAIATRSRPSLIRWCDLR